MYLKKQLDYSTLEAIAAPICGDNNGIHPEYRSSFYITEFFKNVGINRKHDGTSRNKWVYNVLKDLDLSDIEKIILKLVDIRLYKGNRENLKLAFHTINNILELEGIKVVFNGPIAQLEYFELDMNRLISEEKPLNIKETGFLNKEYQIDIKQLGLNNDMLLILQNRLDEINVCINNKCLLSSIILMGSTIEGLLLDLANRNPKKFNQSSKSPKDKNGIVKTFSLWSLSNLIDVSYDIGYIDLDVKKFSHSVRDFRNYIHPNQQIKAGFIPNENTIIITFQVLKAIIDNLQSKLI
ncbi:MAG: hypothetical protein V3575_00560 [Candidatus Absconditabacteria bacterium]